MTDTTTHAGPGVYPHMSDAEYFAHPALSHSDCKLLLDSPAKFAYLRANPSEVKAPTADMLFGSAVHSLLLGGPDVVCIEADSWRTKAAQEMKTSAEANGAIPLLVDDFKGAHSCALGVRMHPLARKLLDAAEHTELVAIWDDDDVQRRVKVDAVTGRFVIDLKTTYNAATDDFGRSAAKYGYATQAAYYLDAARACLGIDNPAFLFIAVEKDPPFLVNVIQLDDYDVELGAKRNRKALDLYRQCRDSGEWPAYGDGINVAQLPRWAEIEMETE